MIWVWERESRIGRVALDHLEREGFRVQTLSMGTDMVRRVRQIVPCLVSIETAVLNGPALDLCRGIRQLPSLAGTPVVLLCPNASEEERVVGLESGADDYITESCSGREVVARFRAILRRFMRQGLDSRAAQITGTFSRWSSVGVFSPAIRIGDIEIDPAALTVLVRGSVIAATILEFRLLYFLLHNEGRVFSRDELLGAVWGPEFVELRSVDACIRRLRRKIEPEPLRPTYLRTVRGAGYCLQARVDRPEPFHDSERRTSPLPPAV